MAAISFPDYYRVMLKRLREAREAAGLTQAEVAHALGRPQSFVSKIESGERRLDPIEIPGPGEISVMKKINGQLRRPAIQLSGARGYGFTLQYSKSGRSLTIGSGCSLDWAVCPGDTTAEWVGEADLTLVWYGDHGSVLGTEPLLRDGKPYRYKVIPAG